MVATPSRNAVAYAPGPVPANTNAELTHYLAEEFGKIQTLFRALAAGHVEIAYKAPDRPRDGDFRLVDGTHWSPDSSGSPGFYGYYSGSWHKLG